MLLLKQSENEKEITYLINRSNNNSKYKAITKPMTDDVIEEMHDRKSYDL